MINGVIFDFNGTLFDDWNYHVITWQKLALKEFNINLTKEYLEKHLNGLPNEAIINHLAKNKINPEKNIALSKEKEAMYRDIVKEINPQLIKGATKLFTLLKSKDIPFTIASASIKENIDFFIKTFNLAAYMDPTTIVYDNGSFDNKAQMYKKAMENLKLKPHKTLIFEDSISGIKGALSNNAQVIIIAKDEVKNRYHAFNALKIISTYDELLKDEDLMTSLF